jgi:hypothetical protein
VIALKTNRRFQKFMAKNYEKSPADFHGSAFFNLRVPTKLIINCHLNQLLNNHSSKSNYHPINGLRKFWFGPNIKKMERH